MIKDSSFSKTVGSCIDRISLLQTKSFIQVSLPLSFLTVLQAHPSNPEQKKKILTCSCLVLSAISCDNCFCNCLTLVLSFASSEWISLFLRESSTIFCVADPLIPLPIGGVHMLQMLFYYTHTTSDSNHLP